MKFVFIDWGVIMFKSIFTHETHQKSSEITIAMSMLISSLKRIGIDKDDKIIIAVDSPEGSWRKEVDGNYKANRKKEREKHRVNWQRTFDIFKVFLEQIDMYTPFHVIVADKLEADDIISCGVRKFKEDECIIVSNDTDFEQLLSLKNVKWYNNQTKRYKTSKNPLKSLAKKIEKEKADNLLSPILTKKDYDRRLKIVSLLKLPKEIEKKADDKLNHLPEKEWDIASLPVASVHNRLYSIYDKNQVVKLINKRKKNENICNKQRQAVLSNW